MFLGAMRKNFTCAVDISLDLFCRLSYKADKLLFIIKLFQENSLKQLQGLIAQ